MTASRDCLSFPARQEPPNHRGSSCFLLKICQVRIFRGKEHVEPFRIQAPRPRARRCPAQWAERPRRAAKACGPDCWALVGRVASARPGSAQRAPQKSLPAPVPQGTLFSAASAVPLGPEWNRRPLPAPLMHKGNPPLTVFARGWRSEQGSLVWEMLPWKRDQLAPVCGQAGRRSPLCPRWTPRMRRTGSSTFLNSDRLVPERTGGSLRDLASEKLFSVRRERPRLGLVGPVKCQLTLTAVPGTCTDPRVALLLHRERKGPVWQTRGPGLPGAAPTGQPAGPPPGFRRGLEGSHTHPVHQPPGQSANAAPHAHPSSQQHPRDTRLGGPSREGLGISSPAACSEPRHTGLPPTLVPGSVPGSGRPAEGCWPLTSATDLGWESDPGYARKVPQNQDSRHGPGLAAQVISPGADAEKQKSGTK